MTCEQLTTYNVRMNRCPVMVKTHMAFGQVN